MLAFAGDNAPHADGPEKKGEMNCGARTMDSEEGKENDGQIGKSLASALKWVSLCARACHR